MEDDRSKSIKFFANQLSNADRDIEVVKKLDVLSGASLSIYNGSGEKHELQIWEPLREPLMSFLLNHYKEEKEKIYINISEELNKTK